VKKLGVGKHSRAEAAACRRGIERHRVRRTSLHASQSERSSLWPPNRSCDLLAAGWLLPVSACNCPRLAPVVPEAKLRPNDAFNCPVSGGVLRQHPHGRLSCCRWGPRSMLRQFLVLVLICGSSASYAQSQSDACADLIPISVQNAVATKYPSYRIVRVSDYSAKDIASERQYHEGSPCLGVASALVNTDATPDFAFLITSASRHSLLIAALSASSSSWRVETVMDFGNDGIGRSFVNSQRPGAYTDLYARADGPGKFEPEPGRVRTFRARRPGFVAGAMEASSIAFFHTGRRWVHLWLSD